MGKGAASMLKEGFLISDVLLSAGAAAVSKDLAIFRGPCEDSEQVTSG